MVHSRALDVHVLHIRTPVWTNKPQFKYNEHISMYLYTRKSTKVQTLGVVALHATIACTDDVSIVGLSPLNRAIV